MRDGQGRLMSFSYLFDLLDVCGCTSVFRLSAQRGLRTALTAADMDDAPRLSLRTGLGRTESIPRLSHSRRIGEAKREMIIF